VQCLCALAAGVIFGAMLGHMIPECNELFSKYLTARYGAEAASVSYPFGMLLLGGVFILLMGVDRLVISHGIGHGQGHSHAFGHSHGHGEGHEAENHITEAILHVQAEVEREEAAKGEAATKEDATAPATAAAGSSSEPAASDAIIAVQTDAHAHSHGHLHGGPSDASAVVAARMGAAKAVRAWVFIAALSLHSVFDGLSIGSEKSVRGFTSMVIAVLAHKAFDGIAAGAAVYPAQLSMLHSIMLLAMCALATPLGILIAYLATSQSSSQSAELAAAIIIGLSAGSFLFISITELLPAAIHDGRLLKTKLVLFVLGWGALMALGVNG
jgi:zinc transporter 1/2/3